MYDEIEIKILEIDPKKVIQKLEGLWAQKIFDGPLHSRYFSLDLPEQLRIRRAGDHYTLDYKYYRMIDGLEKNDEISTIVWDMETTTAILEKLGYTIDEDEEKYRVSYILNDCRIDIDKHKEIPHYLEIEWSSDDSIHTMIRHLTLEDKPTTNLTADQFKYRYDEFIAELRSQ